MFQSSPLFAPRTSHLQDILIKVDNSSADEPHSFCSLATLQSLRLIHRSWIELEHQGKKLPTQLWLSSTITEDNVIFVSRCLAFNLQLSSSSISLKWNRLVLSRAVQTKVKISSSVSEYFPPCQRVVLARVRTYSTDKDADLGPAIKHYFKTPRVLFVGQLILVSPCFTEEDEEEGKENASTTVPLDLYNDEEGEENAKATSYSTQEYVAFKIVEVNKVHPSAYFTLDLEESALLLSGTCESELPPQLNPGFVHPHLLSLLSSTKHNAILVCGKSGTGKRTSVENFAKSTGRHVYPCSFNEFRAKPLVEEALSFVEHSLENASQLGVGTILLCTELEALPLNKPEHVERIATQFSTWFAKYEGLTVICLSSSKLLNDLPAVLRSVFLFELQVEVPTLEQRRVILGQFLSEAVAQSLATKTAGKTAKELLALVSISAQRALHESQLELNETLVVNCLKSLPNIMEEVSGQALPKIQETKWDDVGGLQHVKDEIMDMVHRPSTTSSIRSRSGILLFGPPGTGKTLLAKAVATECNMSFISVKGPELLDAYIGESERKVRQVFETARQAKPCVLFFDELDALAPKRGRGSDSGGVTDRVVSQLLTEIDGMTEDVFVIGATNRPDLLDPSLLRPGRFDRLLFLGISQNLEEQARICQAQTRKFVHAEPIDFTQVLSTAGVSRNLTGADFYALCSEAMALAMKRKVNSLSARAKEEGKTVRKLLSSMPAAELDVTVNLQDYLDSIQKLVPSVSQAEMARYEDLRLRFSTSLNRNKGKHSPESTSSSHSSTGGFIPV